MAATTGDGSPDASETRLESVRRASGRLLAAYRSTDIQIHVGSEWRSWTRMGDGRTGPPPEEVLHVITAFNPFSQRRPPVENEAASRELEAVLTQGGRTHRPAVNRAPDGDWEEPGFAVEGLTRDEARELGRRFGQHAVFEIQGNELRIVGCFEDRVIRAKAGTRDP